MSKPLFQKRQDECEHKNLEFKYTREDWFDGDEDDIYECKDCGKRVVKYVPR